MLFLPQIGTVVPVAITGVDDVGLIVKHHGFSGYVPFDEVSKYKLDRARAGKMVGRECKAKVLGYEGIELRLSIRQAYPDVRIPWDTHHVELGMVATSTLNTGDVVLFYDEHSFKDRFLAWGAGAPCSHVGMVVRNPPWLEEGDREGIFLLESGYEGFPDAEDQQIKFGVQLNYLDSAVSNYGSPNIHVRRLVRHPWWTDTQLTQMHEKVHGKRYDTDPVHWVETFLEQYDAAERTDDRYWCSALVARLYVELGVLPPDFDWTLVTPGHFENLALPLQPECKLGPIEGPVVIA